MRKVEPLIGWPRRAMRCQGSAVFDVANQPRVHELRLQAPVAARHRIDN